MMHNTTSAGPRPKWRSIVFCCLTAGLLAGCGNQMSPEQAAAISKYQNLGGTIVFQYGGYRLKLNSTRVADEDLVQLPDIKNLKRIDLQSTAITDAGLKYLEPVSSLTFVDVSATGVTEEGVERLRKALPNVEVRY